MGIFVILLHHLKLIIVMFRKLLLLCILISFCPTLFAQVGIGTSTPDPSSILDITATNKGLLIPRVALSSLNNSTIDGKFKNATGLLIYNTNSSLTAGTGFYYWDGSIWNSMKGSGQNSTTGGWSFGGNAVGTDNFLGTTNAQSLNFRVNNVAVGTFKPNNSFNLGANSASNGARAVALGFETVANGDESTALGRQASAGGARSIAAGFESVANGDESTAIGRQASATGARAIAAGFESKAQSDESAAFGRGSLASAPRTLAAGFESTATAEDATALGRNADASKARATATGFNSVASADESAAYGSNARSTGLRSTALGHSANANSEDAIALGSESRGLGIKAIAIGKSSNASAVNSLAIGNSAQATGQNSTAIGNGSSAPNANTLILGNNVNVGIGTDNPTAKFQINGSLRIVDGNQGANKVLTSDANGNATWQTPSTGSNTSAASSTEASFAEVYLSSDKTINLARYNTTSFPAAEPGLSSSDMKISGSGIQPTSAGIYRVTYTITYKKNQYTGTNTIGFFIAENTNKIARTEVVGSLKNGEYATVSVTKLLELKAWQTYYLGMSATSQWPHAGPSITLSAKQTNLSIERIN